MDKSKHDESALFLMRLWGDDPSTAGESTVAPAGTNSALRPKWRGKLLHVVSGEAQYFSDWPSLLSILQSMFPEVSAIESDSPSPITRHD